ncbi:MAG: 50S ribosomal protein L4 [Armatimonadetes bacterium]|nr:50S ribosomal protein L4 [Armatimonadota bacterium]
MAQLEIKSAAGKVVGKHEVAGHIADAQPLMSVLHRAVVTEEANARQGTQSAKTRSEVRGGGRKPYRQKKTGNARQGSTRSPHYAHGGMALAVKPRDYDKDLNKKERRSAIKGALSAQLAGDNVIVVDKIEFTAPKTKEAATLLKSVGVENVKRVLVIVKAVDVPTYKSFRNLPNVTVRTAPSREEGAKTNTFSTRDLLIAHKIVVSADALKQIEEVWA